MNTRVHQTAAACLLAAFAAGAFAQDDASADRQQATPGLTRAQVRAELAAAIRHGDMPVVGDSGLRERDVHPGLYPPDPVALGLSRADVKAELADAVRDGDMPAPGDLDRTAREIHASAFAQRDSDPRRPRVASTASH